MRKWKNLNTTTIPVLTGEDARRFNEMAQQNLTKKVSDEEMRRVRDSAKKFRKIFDRHSIIKEILAENPDNTEWIIQSILNNSNCVIVSYDKITSDRLREQYMAAIKTSPWYKILYWFVINKQPPLFKNINDEFHHYNLPIIFENSTFK